MKKIFLGFIVCISICLIPLYTSAGTDWQSIKSSAEEFAGVGLQYEQDLKISSVVNNIADIFTTVGVLAVLAGILITGIKYMMAPPNEAAKLKSKMVGLVFAGIIIIGAYGVWKLVGNFMNNSLDEIKPVTVITPTPTVQPTPKYKLSITPNKVELKVGNTKDIEAKVTGSGIPYFKTTIEFKSEDESVATVTKTNSEKAKAFATITAVSEGTTNIIVTTKEGKEAKVPVTVKPAGQ